MDKIKYTYIFQLFRTQYLNWVSGILLAGNKRKAIINTRLRRLTRY